MLILLLLATTGASPIDTISALDIQFCADYNAGNVAAVAANYNPGADIITPNASAIVKGANAAAYFAAQIAAGGMTNLKLTPLTVAPDNDALYHEIGNATHARNPRGTLYYRRWFFATAATAAAAGKKWQIAMDATSISGGWHDDDHDDDDRTALPPAARVQVQQPPSNATKIVQAKAAEWAARYNKGDFAGVANMYQSDGSHEWARLVAPAAHDFLEPNAAFFNSMHDPREGDVQSVELAPYLVLPEGDALIHELGLMQTAAHDSSQTTHGVRSGYGRAPAAGVGSGGHAYYARWERPNSTWVIATGIMSIGEH